METIPKRFLESDKVLSISCFGVEVGYYYWDRRRIEYHSINNNSTDDEILNSILESSNFFNPITDEIVDYDARDNFKLFLIKACPKLLEYAYSYKIIDGKFNKEMAYAYKCEYPDGYVRMELVTQCFYDRFQRKFYYREERGHELNVVKILKNSKTNFIFIDDEGRKNNIMFLTLEKYEKYKNGFFNSKPPSLMSTEDVQGYISRLI